MAGDQAGFGTFRSFVPRMNSAAKWLRLGRVAFAARNELAIAEEVASIAAEVRIATSAIDPAVGELPNSAALLGKMMIALGIEPDSPTLIDHVDMDKLRRLCTGCDHKPECTRDLAAGTATENFYAYCPNSKELDSLYVEMTFMRL